MDTVNRVVIVLGVIGALCVLRPTVGATATDPSSPAVTFAKDISPILQKHCGWA